MELSLRRTLKIVKKVAHSDFPNVAAHFKRMLERPSVKKVLAYEKEVNEDFAKTAWATIELRRHAQLPRSESLRPRLAPAPGAMSKVKI